MAGAYYPSLSVKFRIRFDESLHANSQTPAPTSNNDSGSTTPPAKAAPLPLILAGENADQLSQVVSLVPLRCSVELPGFRQASKFEIDMLYSDFPLEPDITRAIGVEIYLGTVDPGQWGQGNTQPPLPGSNTVEAGQSPRLSQITQTDENLLMYGLVDKHSVEFTDKGFLVKFEGRDLSGIMLDLPCGTKTLPSLNTNMPIDNVVQQIINGVPLLKAFKNASGQTIKVTTVKEEWPKNTIPSPGVAGDWTRVNQGAQAGNLSAGGVPASEPNSSQPAVQTGVQPQLTGTVQKLKIWDLITQECNLVGAVPYFHGDELRIRPAQVLHDPHKLHYDSHFPTPFKGGKPRAVPGYLEPLVIRTLTFGRDIATLKRTRKLGGFKVPAIRVVSVDTSSKQRGKERFIEQQWPPADTRVGSSDTGIKAKTTVVAPSGLVAQTDVLIISVPGIKSKARLLEIAKNIYEEVGRCEVGGSCSTKDLASLGGDNADPDMLRLRPGDPVQFNVDNRQLQSYPPPISAVAANYRQSPEALAAVLQQKLGGKDPNLAKMLAYSLTGNIAERQSIYRVNHVRFSWDSRSGIGIDFDFQNYIESRAGITTKDTKPNVSRPVTASKSQTTPPAVPTATVAPVGQPSPRAAVLPAPVTPPKKFNGLLAAWKQITGQA